jgi:HNH endonuclease
MLNDPRFPDKIWSRIHVVPQNGCWIWTGSLNPDSYGYVYLDGKTRWLHRLFYEAFKGPIPENTEIDHLCRVRHCCNPEHLEAVPHQVNIDRGNGRKGFFKRQCCIHGHPYTPETTYISPKGVRACRICRTVTTNKSRTQNIEQVRERNRRAKAESYRKNREQLIARVKDYAARNPEKVKARMRDYYQRNKHKWKKVPHE